MKKVIAIITTILLFISLYISSAVAMFMNSKDGVLNSNEFQFNKSVEECRTTVNLYLKPALKDIGITDDSNIEDFTIIVLSMIQVHFDNNVSIGTDPMNIYTHKSHKNCSMCINSCIDKKHSIMVGIKYFSNDLKDFNVKKVDDEKKIKLALETYYNDITPNVIKLSSSNYATKVLNYYDIYMTGGGYSGSSDLVKVALKYAQRKERGTIFQEKYGFPRTAEWCTLFCMYCADKVKLSRKVAPLDTYVPTVVSKFQSKGQYKSSSSGYIPKPGDFIILYGHGHIGMVWKTKGSIAYTIEGNRHWGGLYNASTSFVDIYSMSITSADGYCTYKRK